MSSKFGQSKLHSAIEMIVNIGSGMIIAYGVNQLMAYYAGFIASYIWPGFHFELSMSSNIFTTVVLTVVSVLRGYCWRRAFNYYHVKKLDEELAQIRQSDYNEDVDYQHSNYKPFQEGTYFSNGDNYTVVKNDFNVDNDSEWKDYSDYRKN